MSGIYLQIIEGREAVGGWKTELGRSENRGKKKEIVHVSICCVMLTTGSLHHSLYL